MILLKGSGVSEDLSKVPAGFQLKSKHGEAKAT